MLPSSPQSQGKLDERWSYSSPGWVASNRTKLGENWSRFFTDRITYPSSNQHWRELKTTDANYQLDHNHILSWCTKWIPRWLALRLKPNTHYPQIRSVNTVRIYGRYTRARFWHPQMRPVCTGSVYPSPIYGCTFRHPYIRVTVHNVTCSNWALCVIRWCKVTCWMVGWSLASLFNTNSAISETKG